jgi:hypothetical protein
MSFSSNINNSFNKALTQTTRIYFINLILESIKFFRLKNVIEWVFLSNYYRITRKILCK